MKPAALVDGAGFVGFQTWLRMPMEPYVFLSSADCHFGCFLTYIGFLCRYFFQFYGLGFSRDKRQKGGAVIFYFYLRVDGFYHNLSVQHDDSPMVRIPFEYAIIATGA